MRHDADRSSSPGWLLDEAAHAGREIRDVDHVALYDDKEDANAAGEVELLLDLGLDERSEVVDLGAGTGQFTVTVVPPGATATCRPYVPEYPER